MYSAVLKSILLCMGLLALGACSGAPSDTPDTSGPYASVTDGDITLPRVPIVYLVPPNRRTTVDYTGTERPGTIVVDPYAKFLYYVEEDGQATRYPVAVGREGRGFKGSATIRRVDRLWPQVDIQRHLRLEQHTTSIAQDAGQHDDQKGQRHKYREPPGPLKPGFRAVPTAQVEPGGFAEVNHILPGIS